MRIFLLLLKQHCWVSNKFVAFFLPEVQIITENGFKMLKFNMIKIATGVLKLRCTSEKDLHF